MEDWVPLYVAAVASVTALGVAFWNSRGEFAELKQLRSMNEALSGMDPNAEMRVLKQARDRLAVRIAARVSAAPARRRLTWWVVSIALAIAAVVILTLWLTPIVPTWFFEFASWAAAALGLVAVGVTAWTSRAVSKSEVASAQRRADALMRAYAQRAGEDV